jgi:hypothetical protein
MQTTRDTLYDILAEAKAVRGYAVNEAIHPHAFLHLVPKSSYQPDTKT